MVFNSVCRTSARTLARTENNMDKIEVTKRTLEEIGADAKKIVVFNKKHILKNF